MMRSLQLRIPDLLNSHNSRHAKIYEASPGESRNRSTRIPGLLQRGFPIGFAQPKQLTVAGANRRRWIGGETTPDQSS